MVSIEQYSSDMMDYCIAEFDGNADVKNKTGENVVGEALTLFTSYFGGFGSLPLHGRSTSCTSLDTLKFIKRHFPRSILYVDAQKFTPIYGVSAAIDIHVFQFFIEWHLEQSPLGKGGLYHMSNSSVLVLDVLFDKKQDITAALDWLRQKSLITVHDVNQHLLIHRAVCLPSCSSSTLRFLLDLYPRGACTRDVNGNLPIDLFLSLRPRPTDTFTDDDFAIIHMLVSHSINNGEINTIGGLLHRHSQDKRSYLLAVLLKQAGKANNEKVWELVKGCHAQASEYSKEHPTIHAPMRDGQYVPENLQEMIGHFGTIS